MADQDNVPMEKMSLSGNDFAEDLGGNDFGIQDTQVVATRDLQKFLLSDPDDVKEVEDETKKAEAEKLKQQQAQQSQQQQNETPEEKQKREQAAKTKKETEEADGRSALENLLYGDKDDEGEGTDGKKPNGSTQQTPSDGDDTYVTLGKDLLRLGVFSKNSEEETEETISIKSPEEFLERFNLEKKKGAINILENFLSQFGDDYKKMFDAVFVNGVKPNEYLTSFAKVEAIKDLDLTNESNQERIVRAYYKGLKWDDAKIDGKIAKMKDYGDLEDEAKTYHQVLVEKETDTINNIEKAKQEETQKQKDKDAAIKKSYQRILTEKLKTQEVDGVPLIQKDAEEVLSYLTEKRFKLESGELLSEFDKDLMELNRPENHEQKIKLGLLLKKKLDLTSVKKTTISKKSDALFTLSTKNAKQSSKEKEMKSFF
jgi:hypothetical protein